MIWPAQNVRRMRCAGPARLGQVGAAALKLVATHVEAMEQAVYDHIHAQDNGINKHRDYNHGTDDLEPKGRYSGIMVRLPRYR